MKTLTTLISLLATLTMAKAEPSLLKDTKTILFLGDSITQAGQYVTNFDA